MTGREIICGVKLHGGQHCAKGHLSTKLLSVPQDSPEKAQDRHTLLCLFLTLLPLSCLASRGSLFWKKSVSVLSALMLSV